MKKVFTVEHNPQNNAVTITNTKSKESWNLTPSEFVYGTAMFNDVVDGFPDYVHKEVWKFSDAFFAKMRSEK